MNDRIMTIPISTGLISEKHRHALGVAVWEFLWLIDRTTREIIDSEGRWGIVLGGKPVQAEDIATTYGLHVQTVRRNLRSLEDGGYIKTKRVNGGQQIMVSNSIKWLWRNNANTKGYCKPGAGSSSGKNPPGFRPSQVDWEAEAKRGL